MTTYNATLRVTDAGANTADSEQTVELNLGLTGTLPSATENVLYANSLSAGGGTPPYTWSIDSVYSPGDPYFSSVVALLHFDGSDGATTFTDVTGKTWTAAGNAQIDTAQSKFGGASGLFDGSGDYISTPDSADWAFGSGDFTVECWVRNNRGSIAGTDFPGIISQRTTSNQIAWSLFQDGANSGNYTFGYSTAGSTGTFTTMAHTGGLLTGQWVHLAVSRTGTAWRFFVDGTQVASLTNSDTIFNSTSVLSVGRRASNSTSTSNSFDGWIDDLRITKGVGRYTSDFTPPTAAFPDTADATISGSALLPPGITLDPDSGVFYGEPGVGSPAYVASPGEAYDFTVRVTDSASPPQTATSAQSLTVERAYNQWSPLRLAGLVTWFDGSDTSTMGLTGSRIDTWNDKARGYQIGTTYGTGTRPTMTGSIGGITCPRYDGTDDRSSLLIGSAPTAPGNRLRGVSKGCIFVVARLSTADTSVTARYIHVDSVNGSAAPRLGIGVGFGGSTFNVVSAAGRRLDADSTAIINGTVDQSTNAFVAGVVADWANTDLFLYVNGSLAASNTSFQTAGGTSSTASTYSDVANVNNTQFFRGDIAEIIVCAAADIGQSDRERLEGYLAHKWNLEANLPSDHPYKVSPP